MKDLKLPDPNETLGIELIYPIDRWYEKGHFWAKELVFPKKIIAIKNRGTTLGLQIWGTPKLEIKNLGIKSFGQTSSCKCKDCVKGRKEVKKGWRPK